MAESSRSTRPAGPGRAQELRVHGVGGSPGPRMVGFESADDIVVVGEGLGGTSVLARRDDPTVESYDWGDLTSGTGSKPFWVFLLPFTLVNLAGWMHPPATSASKGRLHAIRALVHVLSALLTATYVFTFGIILVDLVGYQWARRLAASVDPKRYPLTGPQPIVTQQRVGVVLALLALVLLVLALVHVAGASQERFEQTGTVATLTGEEKWDADEDLSSPGFFFHPGPAKVRLRLHRALAFGCVVLVAIPALHAVFVDTATPPNQLDLGRFLTVSSAVAYLCVGLLWITSLGLRRGHGERWARSGPAIAATLAFALVNAVVSGTILALLKRLNDWPNRPAGAPQLLAGPEVNLVDVWGGLTVVLATMAVVLGIVVIFFPPEKIDLVKRRTSEPGRPVDGLDDSMRKPLARAIFFVALAHRGGVFAFAVALLVYLAGLATTILRVEHHAGWPFVGLPPPEDTSGVLYRVGAYLLPVLALLVVQAVRKGRTGARTFASTLWDVFTFWPRRFSPLAVRPYSERAVPELKGRIRHHTAEKEPPCPLVLGAHSQGSILAFAALAPLPPDRLQRVALVTYGCPVSTIYSMFFPAYFGPGQVALLGDKLPAPAADLAGWCNFYRRTDPIGGPVHSTADAPVLNTQVPDPFEGPATDIGDATPPLERDAPPWLRISGHSHYMQEPVLKHWLRRVRTALGQGR